MADKFGNHYSKNTKDISRSSYLCMVGGNRVDGDRSGSQTFHYQLFNMVSIFEPCECVNYSESLIK